MERIKLEISALSQSVSFNQSFAVILAEVEGSRKLPIVIGMFEAQAIAMELEEIPPSRPLTHDLFKNTLEAYNISLVEVIINELKEGVFYAQLVCEQFEKQLLMDSRTSDAIALAVRFQCPIYTYEAIMSEGGIILDEEEVAEQQKKTAPKPKSSSRKKEVKYTDNSVEELEQLLEKAISEEDYEKAARIRDEINKRDTGL